MKSKRKCARAFVRPLNATGSRLLEQAARWAETEPCLVAAALAAYRRRHNLDDERLAAYLGCSVAVLHGLALCHRPSRAAPGAAAEVRRLAAYVRCNPDRLATVLQEGDTLTV